MPNYVPDPEYPAAVGDTPKQIWKYRLAPPGEEVTFTFPGEARVVHVRCVDNIPYMWIELDPGSLPPVRKRAFRLYATGASIRGDAQYTGTCFQGPFVWHLYEL